MAAAIIQCVNIMFLHRRGDFCRFSMADLLLNADWHGVLFSLLLTSLLLLMHIFYCMHLLTMLTLDHLFLTDQLRHHRII